MSLFVDIKKTFPGFELDAKIEAESEVVALLGGSGCGKSLTLKCIAGIEKPDAGRIVINGKTVFDSDKHINLPPQSREVGFLFQNYALFPNMTVSNNIACVIKRPNKEKEKITEDIIKTFKLQNIKDLYPRQISGGQQQRTALARILVSNPRILMLDEPFSALDSHLKWSMEQEIVSVLADFKGTTIFVSHNRDEAYRVSDKIAVMNYGKIESIGSKEEIFKSPRTLTAAAITGCKNFSKAEKSGETLLRALDWDVTFDIGEPVSCPVKYIGIRAHHFEVKKSKDTDNVFPCQIHKIIDEPFEKTLIFSFKSQKDDVKNPARLVFRISKDKWDDSLENTFFIHVPKDKVMCLE